MLKKLVSIMVFVMLLSAAFTAEEERIVEEIKVLMKTNMGTIVLELWPEKAPKTVDNFLNYVNDKFYDGVVFHRVIDNFMIQTGGFTADGARKDVSYQQIRNEADNEVSNKIGTIAMARTNYPHSATSQFFINVKDNNFLDHRDKKNGWGYCVFGEVTAGLEVVNKIKSVKTHVNPKTGMKDWPVEDVIIEKMEIIE